MNTKKLLRTMQEKEKDENNYSFFGSTGLQVILKPGKLEVIGRYSPELQVAWIYPDKIYKNIKNNLAAQKIKLLRDAIYGVAIGDSLGCPVQFKNRDTFPYVREMLYCDSFHKKPGTWTDDTSLTLALCDSIRKRKKVDTRDIQKRFKKWLFCGKYTQDGKAFDVGKTCYRAIRNGKGINDYKANGNGSLMRILPLAFLENITDQEITEVSSITHAHSISCEACKIYIHIAKDLLDGKSIHESIKMNAPKTYSIFTSLNSLENRQREEIKSTGFVVDTLEAALWSLLKTNSFRDAVETAVNLGGDADTIGAVTGGLAGIIYGIENIPKEWIEPLRKKNIIEKYLFSL